MTIRFSMTQFTAACLCLAIIGCSGAPADPKAVALDAFSSAENAISKADWTKAYLSLEYVLRSNDPAVVSELKSLVTKHPEIVAAAETEIIRRAHFQADYAAKREPSQAAYLANLQTELDGYKALATTPEGYENLLREVKRIFDTTVPTVFPGTDLKIGMSLPEVLRLVDREPIKKTAIRPFHGPEGEIDVLEFTFFIPTKPDERTTAPFWLAFHKSQLLKVGLGSAREAEYSVYEGVLLDLARKKKIKYADGAKALASKHLSLYGEKNAYANEYWSYLAMLGEQIDDGKISETEAEYLLAKKSNEVSQKVSALEIEKDRRQTEQSMAQLAAVRDAEMLRQGQLNQSLMMMGLGMQMMQLSQPAYQAPNRIFMNCTTRKVGGTLYTDCH